MMTRFGTTLVAAALMFSVGACSKDGDVLAKVGDKAITVEEFEAFVSTLPPHMQARAATPSGKKQILEHRVRETLISVEAEERGIADRPEVRMQIEAARQRVLLQELMKDVQREVQVTDEDVAAHFEENKDRYRMPERYRAQQILVKVPPNGDAKSSSVAYGKVVDAHRRIKRGEAFDKVAREVSEDPNADKGGDLGYVERGRFNADFEKAALALSKGDVSEPFKTSFGWHIVKLVDRAAEEPAVLDDRVKDQIRRQLVPRKRQESFEAFMSTLRDRYEVEIDDDRLAGIGPQPESRTAPVPESQPAPAQPTAPGGSE
jgi:peptidyl-prolyl cis-trans isomerase C